MAERDKGAGGFELSRRDFLKASAATAAIGGVGIDFAVRTSRANAAEVDATYNTTCPYCSASCGQLVDVDAAGNVLDVYGDPDSPFNDGGLCAKGAGTFQLVTNPRRVGAWSGSHPVNNVFSAVTESGDGLGGQTDFSKGIAYRREGNGSWSRVGLTWALDDIATKLVAARAVDTAGWAAGNSKSVAFFGSSHLNNEPNNVYRKIVANFGTSNVEHQARI